MAILIVVSRTAGQTFQLVQTLAPQFGRDVELIWDRRIGDRRRPDRAASVEWRRVDRRRAEVENLFLDARRMERRQTPASRMPERRQAERRRRMPDTWWALGFVLVRPDSPAVPTVRGEISD